MNEENKGTVGEEGIHMFEPKTFTIPEGDDRQNFTKGDLVVTCHNCGNEDLLSAGVEHGIQVVLPTNNWHEVRLTCSKCNSAMSLHFVLAEDGEIKPIEEPKEEIEDAKVIEMESDDAISVESAMTDEVANELIDESTEDSTEA